MGIAEEVFGGMDRAELNGKGTFISPGMYTVKIKAFRFKPNGFRGKSIIVEYEILASSNPAHPVGSSASWILKLDKPQWKGDCKALVLAATGSDPKSVPGPDKAPELHAQAMAIATAAADAEYAAKAGIPHDVLTGIVVRLEAVAIKTKEGKDFTVHNWSPVAA